MSKKLEGITENLKRSYSVKHSIVFVLFLVCTVDRAYATTFFCPESKKKRKQNGAKERMLGVLKVENENSSLYKELSNSFNNQTEEKAEEVSVIFEINKYKNKQDRILRFDDSIKYDTITIYEETKGAYTSSITSHNLCIRLIEAFGNLQAKQLIITDINSYIEKPYHNLSQILPKDSISNNILDVKEIFFENVCKRFALRVLGLFQFKHPVGILFRDTDSYRRKHLSSCPNTYNLPKTTTSNIRRIVFKDVDIRRSAQILQNLTFKGPVEIIYDNSNRDIQKCRWEDLEALPTYHTYKMISMRFKRIEDFTELSEPQGDQLKTILPVLYTYCQMDTETDFLCSELQDIIKRSRLLFSETEINKYLEAKNDLESFYNRSSKYRYLSINATSISSDFNHNDNLLEKDITFSRNAKKESTRYNYVEPSYLFEVNIMIDWKVLTPLGIKKILEWAAVHIKDATTIAIVYKKELYKDISLFESMRVEVENMPHLEKISISKHSSPSVKDNIVIRDINWKEKYVRTMTYFDDRENYTLGLSLELYVHRRIKNRGNVYTFDYPTPNQIDTLIICKKCDLKVFKNQEEPKSTDKILSLKEVKSMTWAKLLASSNRNNIEKHLKTAYDLNRNIILAEENFTEVKNYLFKKPIVVLPECLHTICAGCLHEKTRIRKAIKCSSCHELQDLSLFRYFVREQNLNNIQNKYVHSALLDQKSQEMHYVLYECAPFQTSKYYFEDLQEITKPNVIIRKDESMPMKEEILVDFE